MLAIYSTVFPPLSTPDPFCLCDFSVILAVKAWGCCPDAQGVVWPCLSLCWWLLIPSNRPAWARHGWGLRRSRNYTRPSIIAAMQAITVAVPFYMQNSPNEGHNDRGWDRLTARLDCRHAHILHQKQAKNKLLILTREYHGNYKTIATYN